MLRFAPPGFKHPIDVQFPPRCLPVCERCKKNFKTREHCRGRDCHTELAWCETYVCVSLDNSCTGEDGKLLDGPFAAKVVPPIAFNLKGDLNPLTPICAPCKDKNYTRTYCRQNKNHRQLPWSTVYVIVSLKPGVMPERSVTTPSNSVSSSGNKRKKTNNGESVSVNEDSKESEDDPKRKISSSAGGKDTSESGTSPVKEEDAAPDDKESAPEAKEEEGGKEEVASEGDDKKDTKKDTKKADEEEEPLDMEAAFAKEALKLEDIPRSRTFLATVSCKTHRIEVSKLEIYVSCLSPFHILTSHSFLFNSGSILIRCSRPNSPCLTIIVTTRPKMHTT